jgi:CrcB protein
MTWLYVFIGGGAGSMARYGVSRLFPYTDGFPWATFIANLMACLLLGYMLSSSAEKEWSADLKLLMMTGFCGGFSTFSTFSAETFKLIEAGGIGMALVYVLSSIIVCLIGVFIGFQLGKYV